MRAFAALVAAALLAGSLVGASERRSSQPTRVRPVATVAGFDTPDQLRRLRRDGLLDQRKIPRNLSGETV